MRAAVNFLIIFLTIISGSHAQADDITVAVAANFTQAAKHLAKDFEAASGHQVQLAFGASGAHYAQIRQGAPFDAFLSADAKLPTLLEKEGKALPDSRFTYARGRLALWSPKSGLVGVGDVVLRAGKFKHLAIANPRLAPYGQAAQQTLTALGLWDSLQTTLVRGENIGQTYQFVRTGAAELGFVALSQVMEEDPTCYWVVPQKLHPPLDQQAILLSDTPAARAFLAFIKSDAGKTIIHRYGYE